MKLKRKGLTIIIASFAAVLTLSTIVVVAYFAVYSNKKNTIRPSENVLQISEEYQPPVEQKVNDNVYKKEISVVNQGNSPCYIRVYADFSDSNVRSRSYFSNNQDGEHDFYSAQRSNTGNTYIANLETVAPNWRFVPDDDEASELAGYYYYTKKVDPGEKTDPLFTYVKTKNENLDQIQQYDILVYSESVQLSDTHGNIYNDYQAAWQDKLS